MAIFIGGDGNDILNGNYWEADTMFGGLGDDILNGWGGGEDFLDGGLGDDVLTGYFLVGGAGNDYLIRGVTMLGGEGNDTYEMGYPSLVITIMEFANEGTDLVLSNWSWTLGANFENLTLTGVNAANGTGNELNNRLIGNEASNLLIGGAGDDELDGRGGHDFLIGGTGNDRYYVGIGDPGDTVVENANEGTDLVLSYVSFTLGANVENLTLNGTAAVDGTGNILDNTLTGNSAANVLAGGAGDDTLWGEAGADTLIGGAGDDTYRFLVGNGIDTITDTTAPGETNRILFGAGISLSDLTFTQDPLARTLTIQVGVSGADKLLFTNFDPTGVNGSLVVQLLEFADGSVANLVNLLGSIPTGPTEGNDILTGTANDDVINALGGNDVVNALAGNDFIDGGAGADTMLGGVGDDTYVVSLGDTVVENTNEGTDRVLSDISWTLGANLEKLTLTGTTAINGIGNSLNNIFTGNNAANVFTGGTGDDTYYAGVGDTMVENANEGTDWVLSDVSWTLGANIEKLTLIGTGAIDGTGNGLANVLTGNSGANVLTGGAGDDTYGVGAGDTVVEAANAGNDLVLSSVSFTLGANIEKLTLTGTGAIDGTGNGLANVLTGNSGANVLTGGAGDDTYGVSTGDTVVEAANAGNDLVLSTVSWSLGANLERLTLTGTGAIDGTGNELNNTLIGNSGANMLTGLAGNDLFNGGAGVDVLVGGTGDDAYYAGAGDTMVEQANEGTDLVLSDVSWTLDQNIEKLALFGTAAINGTGNSGNNILTGNSAANVLAGGAGDDTYGVAVGDTVVEQANEGIDLVLSNVSFTLGANIENLTLTEAAANGTGNALNNILIGNSGANVLTGGAGDDTYGVSAGDTVVEQANGGVDLVLSGVTWTLGANLEKLTLTGTGSIDGTGNSLNNTLIGNTGANVLTGGAGNDTLAGGLGNDTYRVDRGAGQDTILENDGTVGNNDILRYGATINPLDLVLSQQANHLRIAIHGSTDSVTIQNWYGTPTTAQMETIQAGNGQLLLSSQVDQLIQAMASFSQQTGLTWDQAIDQQPQNVQTVLAASWQ